MHAFLILPLLLALTPQQKQLIKMVKQGDIFAGDDLARSVCDIDEGKRKKEAEAVLKRLKKIDNKAKEIAVEGIEKCMPKDKPKAAEAKKEDEPKDEGKKEEKEEKGRRPATEGTDVADAEEGGESDGKRRPIVGMLDEASDEGEDEGESKAEAAKRKAEEAKRKNEEARLAAKEAKLAAKEAKKAEKAKRAEERRLAAEAKKAERAKKAEEKRLAAEERKAKALAEREERKRKREEELERKNAEAEQAKQAKQEKIVAATEAEVDDEVVEEGLASLDDEAEEEVPPLAAIDEVDDEAAPVRASAAAVSAAPDALRSAMLSYGVGGGLAVVSSVGFLVALGAISIGTFQTAEIVNSAQDGEPDSNEIATIWLGAGTVALLGVAAGAAELAIGIMLMQSGSELVDQATGTQPATQD